MTDMRPYGAGKGGVDDDAPAPPAAHNLPLSQYLTELEFARGIKKSVRTVQRFRRLRIGPPVTYVGKTPMYRCAGIATWLLAQEKAVRE